MIRSKLRGKVFVLCALVLGLMAVAASSAQAEVGSNWRVNGSNITTLEPELKIKEIEELKTAPVGKHLVLLTKILGLLTHILCSAASLFGPTGTGAPKLQKEGKVSEGKVSFSGCATFLSGSTTASAPCLPKTAGVNDTIETNVAKGLLALVGGEGETKITSVSGGPLAVVESSEECAVGLKINIAGTLILKDCQKAIGTELVDHLVEMDNVNSTLTASGQVATIDGSILVALKGAHEGLKWSGIPG